MGKAVAIDLAKKGANVVIVARSVEKLTAVLEELKVRPGLTMMPLLILLVANQF
jgi:short-subunit dehydrogenase